MIEQIVTDNVGNLWIKIDGDWIMYLGRKMQKKAVKERGAKSNPESLPNEQDVWWTRGSDD